MVAIEAVASAVGSREVGSWVKPTIALAFDDPLAAAAAVGADVGAADVAEAGLAAADVVAATVGARVGAVAGGAPTVGGDVGATAVVGLQAASSAEAIGRPRPIAPSRPRNTRRAICTRLSYPPGDAASHFRRCRGDRRRVGSLASRARRSPNTPLAARSVSLCADRSARAGHGQSHT